MKITLIVQNYRCFVRPVQIPIAPDFTAFVGVNNAGKSALMRFLLELRPIFNSFANPRTLAEALHKGIAVGFNETLDATEVFSNQNRDPLLFRFEFEWPNRATAPNNLATAEFSIQRDNRCRGLLTNNAGQQIGGGVTNVISPEALQNEANSHVVNVGVLLEILTKLGNTLYIGPFRNTVSVGTNNNYIDIQIGEAFINQFRRLKTGDTKQHNDDILRLTDDIARIFEFSSLNIDTTPDNKSLHITVDGRPYKQHELGSGLAQFIIVFANASTRKPAYVLIDEPELGLHPRLQLDFLTTLASYATEGVWFSTHSLGLARSITDRIYSVQRVSAGNSHVLPFGAQSRLSEFLGEMSFAAHKELGFEKVLLVEGPTEVKTLQQMFRKFGVEHRIVILPVSGRFNVGMREELEEVMRISSNVSALLDSEKNASGDDLSQQRKDFVSLCAELGINCHVLAKRATENYFPDEIVKQVFGENYVGLTEFQKLKDVAKPWSKNQNWLLARAMTKEQISATDLGEFIRRLAA